MVSYEQYIGESGKDRDCPCDRAEDRKLLVRWMEEHILANEEKGVTARIIEDKVDTLLATLYDYNGSCPDCHGHDRDIAVASRGGR